jgi:hypothetical protein
LGLSAAFLPLLQAEYTQGQIGGAPKRVVVAIQTNGVQADSFFPSGGGGPLSSLSLPECTAPLEPYKSDLIITRGTELRNFTQYGDFGAGHENYSTVFLGRRGKIIDDGGPRYLGGSPTVDQHIAQELTKRGTGAAIESLNLGMVEENYWHQGRCFYRGDDDPITAVVDPADAFDSIFSGGGMPSENLTRLRAQRRSMLDFVAKDLESYAGRLGTDDRMKIQAHLQSIRELELQVDVDTSGCEAPMLGVPADFPARISAHIDLMVAALACDLTRVGTLQTATGHGTNITVTWIDVGGGQEFGDANYHGVAHQGGANKNKVDRWFMEQFAKLIGKLKAVPEGAGTLLDNTVVLWANHMGNGGAHSSNDLPWLLAGGGGGYFRTGQYVRKSGEPVNGILKALVECMELDPNGFGDPEFGGVFSELKA